MTTVTHIESLERLHIRNIEERLFIIEKELKTLTNQFKLSLTVELGDEELETLYTNIAQNVQEAADEAFGDLRIELSTIHAILDDIRGN